MYLPLAGMELKNMINKCDICAFYQQIKENKHILHNFMYTMYFYDYIHLLYIYFTVITTVSCCFFVANPQYLFH